MIWEKRGGGSVVSSRFIFVIALSQFRGPDYLGASNKPGELTVVKLSERRRHFYEDMDNLVYDQFLSFFFFFFPSNTCAQKAFFNESLQRNLFNLKLRFEKQKIIKKNEKGICDIKVHNLRAKP